jgi:hypothetical protein
MTTRQARVPWLAAALLVGFAVAAGLVSVSSAQPLSLGGPALDSSQHSPAYQSSCGDAYEPDAVYTQAVSLAANAPAQTHIFYQPGDVDWVTFPMAAGHVYTISTSNLISPTDTVLELYSADGSTLLGSNDDIAFPSNLASQIVTTAVQSGIYYAKVREFAGRGACSGYGYDLSLASAPTWTLYFPLVAKASPVGISSIEVTQATQNASQPVPLVANRRTAVRVYVYSVTGQPVSNVRVSLTAIQNGITLTPTLVIPPQTAPVSPSQADMSSSFNVELPSSWLTGTVTLTAMAYQGTVPSGGGPNNPATTTLTFNAVPALRIVVVPINYTDTGSNHLYPAPSNTTTTTLEVSDWITRGYPINAVSVSYYSPFAFTGNLQQSSEWSRLLDAVTTLKNADPGGRVYFALVPTTDGSLAWFHGGMSGFSWIDYRAGTGLELPASQGWDADQTGRNTAHEIGHTLNLKHAPSGGAGNPDPKYPYSNGSIGQFGLDVPKWKLWNPATTYDLMGYCPSWTSCSSQWISDYDYGLLYTNQVDYGAAAAGAVAPGLLVRANFDSQGQAALQPVYAFDAPAASLPASSDYTVDLVGPGGQVVASYPVAVLQAESDSLGASGPEVTIQSINAFVPRPTEAVTRVRLVHAGQTVSEKTLGVPTGVSAATTPTVTLSGGHLTVRWGAPATPALVRYTADNGQTWTTLGVDVTGGQFNVDAATLPAGAGRFEITLGDAPAGTSLTAAAKP